MVTERYGPSISPRAPPGGVADSCNAVWEPLSEEGEPSVDAEQTSEAALEEEQHAKEEMEQAEAKVDHFAKAASRDRHSSSVYHIYEYHI